jgi:hypothetical protein
MFNPNEGHLHDLNQQQDQCEQHKTFHTLPATLSSFRWRKIILQPLRHGGATLVKSLKNEIFIKRRTVLSEKFSGLKNTK